MKKSREIDESAVAKSAKVEWLQADAHFDAANFQPSEEDRLNLLSFLDAWDAMMAEQEKLMPMIDGLLVTNDISKIEAAAKWLGNSPHAGRAHLIKKWRELRSEVASDPAPNC